MKLFQNMFVSPLFMPKVAGNIIQVVVEDTTINRSDLFPTRLRGHNLIVLAS